MNDETIKVIRALVIVGGVPFAIYFAHLKEIPRSIFVRNFVISIIGFVGGIIVGAAISSPEVAVLMMALSWWFLYYSMAMRMNNLGKVRWHTLWAMIPVVLIFMLPYLMIERNDRSRP